MELFSSQVDFSNHLKMAIISNCCNMLTCFSPGRDRQGQGRKEKEDEIKKKRDRTVLPLVESGSSLWSYWVMCSNHVFIPRPISVLREMKCSMGLNQDSLP